MISASAIIPATNSRRGVIRRTRARPTRSRILSCTCAFKSAGAMSLGSFSSLRESCSSAASSLAHVAHPARWARRRASSEESNSPRTSNAMRKLLSAHALNARLLGRIFGQQAAQSAASTEESRLYGADGDFQDGCGLFPAPMLHVAEQHYGAVVLGQRLQGAADVAAHKRRQPRQLVVAEEARWSIARGFEGPELDRPVGPEYLLPAATAEIDEPVAQDAAKPRAHARSRTERLSRLEGVEIRLLHEVARVGLPGHEPTGEPVGAIEHAERLLFEGRTIRVSHTATLDPNRPSVRGPRLPIRRWDR